MPATQQTKPTDRKAAAVIVGLLDGPTKTEKEMLALVSAELVSFRKMFGSSGDPVIGQGSVDWTAFLSLRCLLRKMEQDLTDLSKYWKASGMESSLVSHKLTKLGRHMASARELATEIKKD